MDGAQHRPFASGLHETADERMFEASRSLSDLTRCRSVQSIGGSWFTVRPGFSLMSNFHSINRDASVLLLPSINEWLPERHLARFVVKLIAGLNT